MRKNWDSYFMDIARTAATRSTCPRLGVGAIVVLDKRIKGTGYNGSAAGLPHCDDAGCRVLNDHCVRTIHAEVNALMECSSICPVSSTKHINSLTRYLIKASLPSIRLVASILLHKIFLLTRSMP